MGHTGFPRGESNRERILRSQMLVAQWKSTIKRSSDTRRISNYWYQSKFMLMSGEHLQRWVVLFWTASDSQVPIYTGAQKRENQAALVYDKQVTSEFQTFYSEFLRLNSLDLVLIFIFSFCALPPLFSVSATSVTALSLMCSGVEHLFCVPAAHLSFLFPLKHTFTINSPTVMHWQWVCNVHKYMSL